VTQEDNEVEDDDDEEFEEMESDDRQAGRATKEKEKTNLDDSEITFNFTLPANRHGKFNSMIGILLCHTCGMLNGSLLIKYSFVSVASVDY